MKKKKKSDLFQRGLNLLHPHSIHPGVSVLKCELNQREESQRPRRAMEQTVGERMCPGSGMSSNRKWGPLECPSSLSLLLPNTKLTSTPTQQHGRPCLRDWSHTAGDTRFRSGPAGLRAAARRKRKPQRREATRTNEKKKKCDEGIGMRAEEQRSGVGDGLTRRKKGNQSSSMCTVFSRIYGSPCWSYRWYCSSPHLKRVQLHLCDFIALWNSATFVLY